MKPIKQLQEVVNHFFWTLILQGIVFIVLAILILLYPPLLVALVVATFIVVGILSIALAFRIRALWSRLPEFLRK